MMSSIRNQLSRNITHNDKLKFLHEEYKPIQVDIGEVTRLDDYNDFGRYYQTPHGNFPSVTTAIDSITDKSFLVQWRARVGDEEADRISRTARNYGNRIHQTIENSTQNIPFKLPTYYRAIPNLIHKTLYGRITDISLIETFLYSQSIKLAGTVDCFAKWNNEWAIIDWKTSKNEKKREYIDNYFLQGFFYACMIKECLNIHVKKLVIPIFYWDQTESDVFVERIEDVQPEAIDKYQQLKRKLNL
mgnify:CR=1 FL=1